jgi:hypothetical protein
MIRQDQVRAASIIARHGSAVAGHGNTAKSPAFDLEPVPSLALCSLASRLKNIFPRRHRELKAYALRLIGGGPQLPPMRFNDGAADR